MHRFVLAEFNTHRVFSRNSASSRAIPVTKQLERVVDSPAWPVSWPSEQPGMSGGAELEGRDLDDAQELGRRIWESTTELIELYLAAHPDKGSRLHKSVINRWLEPFMWHTVIVTSTEWYNFYKLRTKRNAQPEIKQAADAMLEAFEASTPKPVAIGGWHAPYLRDEDRSMSKDVQLSVSAARCARVSYLTHDGIRDVEKDITLYEQLVDDEHASPLEHVATPHVSGEQKGNFRGWDQLRHKVLVY